MSISPLRFPEGRNLFVHANFDEKLVEKLRWKVHLQSLHIVLVCLYAKRSCVVYLFAERHPVDSVFGAEIPIIYIILQEV